MEAQIEKVIINLLTKACHLWFYNRDNETKTFLIGMASSEKKNVVKVTLEVVE